MRLDRIGTTRRTRGVRTPAPPPPAPSPPSPPAPSPPARAVLLPVLFAPRGRQLASLPLLAATSTLPTAAAAARPSPRTATTRARLGHLGGPPMCQLLRRLAGLRASSRTTTMRTRHTTTGMRVRTTSTCPTTLPVPGTCRRTRGVRTPAPPPAPAPSTPSPPAPSSPSPPARAVHPLLFASREPQRLAPLPLLATPSTPPLARAVLPLLFAPRERQLTSLPLLATPSTLPATTRARPSPRTATTLPLAGMRAGARALAGLALPTLALTWGRLVRLGGPPMCQLLRRLAGLRASSRTTTMRTRHTTTGMRVRTTSTCPTTLPVPGTYRTAPPLAPAAILPPVWTLLTMAGTGRLLTVRAAPAAPATPAVLTVTTTTSCCSSWPSPDDIFLYHRLMSNLSSLYTSPSSASPAMASSSCVISFMGDLSSLYDSPAPSFPPGASAMRRSSDYTFRWTSTTTHRLPAQRLRNSRAAICRRWRPPWLLAFCGQRHSSSLAAKLLRGVTRAFRPDVYS